MLLLGVTPHMIIIHQNPVLPTIPLLQHSPSHYHYAPQRSRLVFASQARCHVHVLHASCGKCPTTPLLKHSTLLNNTIRCIVYDYYSPRPGVTNHTSPATFSTSVSQNISTINDGGQCAMCLYNSYLSQTRGHSQLYEVFHHTSTSW